MHINPPLKSISTIVYHKCKGETILKMIQKQKGYYLGLRYKMPLFTDTRNELEKVKGGIFCLENIHERRKNESNRYCQKNR